MRSSSGEVFGIFYVSYHAIYKQWQFYFFISNLSSF